jgi:hypothetical protein
VLYGHSRLPLDVSLLDTPIKLNIGELYRQFQSLADSRKSCGSRYPLAVRLTIAVFTKLCGSSGARAIAK